MPSSNPTCTSSAPVIISLRSNHTGLKTALLSSTTVSSTSHSAVPFAYGSFSFSFTHLTNLAVLHTFSKDTPLTPLPYQITTITSQQSQRLYRIINSHLCVLGRMRSSGCMCLSWVRVWGSHGLCVLAQNLYLPYSPQCLVQNTLQT